MSSIPVVVPPWEKHYTLSELSELWNVAEDTLRPWFVDEPGVLRFGHSRLRANKKRAYVSMRIPESVAMRVYRDRTTAT